MQFPSRSSVIKIGKPRKVVIRKNRNYGSRKAKFPNWMKVDERETYLFSYTLIYSRKANLLLELRFSKW